MKALWNLIRHKYFKVAAIVSLFLILPVFIIVNQQNQDTRSQAEKSTNLSFSPTTSKNQPLTKRVGDDFYLDVILKPGNNLITILKLDIRYDSNKMQLIQDNPIEVNNIVFQNIIEGPVYSDGRVQVVLSIGPDLSRAISSESRVLTLNFNATSQTKRSLITFGENNSAFSTSINDGSSENVISNMVPAYIKINKPSKGNPGKGKGSNK